MKKGLHIIALAAVVAIGMVSCQEEEPVEDTGQQRLPIDSLLNTETQKMANTSWHCAYDTVVGNGLMVHDDNSLLFINNEVIQFVTTRTDMEGNQLSKDAGIGLYTHGSYQYGTTELMMDSIDESLFGVFIRYGDILYRLPSRHDRWYTYKSL